MRKIIRVWLISNRTNVKYCHDFEVKNDNIEEAYAKSKRFIRNCRDYYVTSEEITE